jgi:two-component system C4-dicarboxylate transport sensor histidine kinase DctB
VRERRAMQQESRRLLEREVERRTAELVTANERLQVESRERELAATRLREAREELAQANRLGSIGQITAGVAHEINQPIAAIRTFAENALRLIERNNAEKVRTNLHNIVQLTSRIGAITVELRRFARRGTPAIAAVQIQSAIRGALLLLGDRLRVMGVDLRLALGADADVRVVADRVRLEQILINLIQNALDAMKDTTDPAIEIAARVEERKVEIVVTDNGPGIPPEVVDKLFTPFVTSKHDGLGLGLGIARDIVREFGGELALASSAAGATFVVTLRRA